MSNIAPIPQNPISETFVWRDWFEKLRSKVQSISAGSSYVFNVKDYGAIGDGIVDDTASIQRTIDAAGAMAVSYSTGAKVVFPHGMYRITATIELKYPGVMLEGQGSQNTSITTTNRSLDPWIRIADQADFQYHMGISSIGFIAYPAQITGSVIYINNVTGIKFYDLNFNGCYTGITIGPHIENKVMWIENTWLTNIQHIGINILGGNDHYLTGVVMTSVNEGLAGIYIEDSQATMIQQCEIAGTGHGLVVIPHTYMSWLNVVNSEFDMCDAGGIYFETYDGGVIQGAMIDACWTGSCSVGVTLATNGTGLIDGVTFVNHRSIQNTNEGFLLSGVGVKNVSITSGQVSGNSAGTSGAFPGIGIHAGVSDFHIQGVMSKQLASRNNTQKYGIEISAGASNHFTICDCDLLPNVTGGLLDSSTGTTKTILGNVGVISHIDQGTTGISGLGVSVLNAYGVASTVTGTTAGYALWGYSNGNPNGYGVYAIASDPSPATGGYALGVSGPAKFISGTTTFTNGGRIGLDCVNGYGIAATVTNSGAYDGYAIWGYSNANPYGYGLYGLASNVDPAVGGYALGVNGPSKFIYGKANFTSGGKIGVDIANDYGVASTVTGSSSAYAIWGYSNGNPSGFGVYAIASDPNPATGGYALGVSGPTNISGTTSAIHLNGSAGTSGYVMTSKGSGATPEWKNHAQTIGTNNNYVTLPGGLIMQWGQFQITSSTGVGTVTFDLTFPNQCNGISATVAANSPSNATCSVASVTTSTATFGLRDANTGNTTAGYVFWTAMGY